MMIQAHGRHFHMMHPIPGEAAGLAYYLWLNKVSANERRHYICNAFSHWLRPGSVIERKQALTIWLLIHGTLSVMKINGISQFSTSTISCTNIKFAGIIRCTANPQDIFCIILFHCFIVYMISLILYYIYNQFMQDTGVSIKRIGGDNWEGFSHIMR